MSDSQIVTITNIIQLHVASGLFICLSCKDGTARTKVSVTSHVLKSHPQIELEFERVMSTLPINLVNPNIQIPNLEAIAGLKCNNCGCISKNKNRASFKQWHHGSSPNQVT